MVSVRGMGKNGRKDVFKKKLINSVINAGETGGRIEQQILWTTMSVKNWDFLPLSV